MSDKLFPVVRAKRDGNSTHEVRIKCVECGAEDHIGCTHRALPDQAMSKKFSHRGWDVDRRGKHRCASCVARDRKEKPVTKPQPQPTQTPLPSPAATSKIPILYMALGDAYDVVARRYKPGWNDQRIAEEVGVAVDFVVKRREADFGPAGDPAREAMEAELKELRRENEALRKKLGNIWQVVSSLKQNIDAVAGNADAITRETNPLT